MLNRLTFGSSNKRKTNQNHFTMKTIVIDYISGLGDFLDSKDIIWEDLGNGQIEFPVPFVDEDIFLLGTEFGLFKERIKNR